MSIHIEEGRVAKKVLITGDPLRAEWVAKTFLKKGFIQFNAVRGALGFTGATPQGKEISIMGTGMGMPTTGIYTREFIKSYGVKQIIRVGSCASLQRRVKLRDVVLVQGSCFDSSINTKRFRGLGFAPIANWDLLFKAQQAAKELSIPIKIGNNFSTDEFYEDYFYIRSACFIH